MKKKLLNAVSTLAIAAIVALNVHVVTSEQTPAFLKWDVVGKILAIGTSGSGSGSGVEDPLCTQCVVRQYGTIKFSCKLEGTEECKSPSKLGATVTCANSVSC